MALCLKAEAEVGANPVDDVSDLHGGERSLECLDALIGDRCGQTQDALGVAILVESLDVLAFADQRLQNLAAA